jgi:tetratricopeptide (TPR) repeat protein
MVLGNGVRIIWLDAYIGEDGHYHAFKRNFQTALQPAAAVPPDAINILIWTLDQNAAPLLFTHTPAQAATLIETHHDKQIIFISSGSLGQHMVPFITAFYPYVHRFYFFCGDIKKYCEFGMDYLSCLQMFDHETDLLVRLARDISSDIIKQGEMYLQIEDAENARRCFEHALTLNNNANEIDTLNSPCLKYVKQLNGDDNNIGLIQRARDMLQQQQQPEDQ